MAMATALAGGSVSFVSTVQKSSRVHGQNVQKIRASSLKKLSVSALKTEAAPVAENGQLSQGASALAGALFAAMATSDSAMAAQQVMALAAQDDSRALALLIPVVPALGWVLFNIAQPGLNQFNKMKGVKGLVAGLGMGALGSMAFSSEAEAAVSEIAQIADNDSRGFLLLAVLAAAIGWVAFNILKPALSQLDRMNTTKGLVAAIGGGAALLAANQADAAEMAQIAEGSDSRGLVLLVVLLPAIGWVLFNILQPALNQLNKMTGSKGVIGAVGLGAAAGSLLSASDADAAQEITQLAADNRPAILLVVLVPAIGWVLYNILKPALNQFNKMRGGK